MGSTQLIVRRIELISVYRFVVNTPSIVLKPNFFNLKAPLIRMLFLWLIFKSIKHSKNLQLE